MKKKFLEYKDYIMNFCRKYRREHIIECITILFVLGLISVHLGQSHFHIDSNFLVAIGTFLLVKVAHSQLKKIAKQNEAQIVFHLEEEWNNKILSQRKECACLFSRWFENKDLIKVANGEEWSKIQETIESILDFYEKIALFVEGGSLSISTVYNLYFYYIQGYWGLAEKSGFIERDRKSHEGGKDFYILTQKLYLRILKEYNLKEFGEDELKKFCEEEKV
jgi:hypothetical protein